MYCRILESPSTGSPQGQSDPRPRLHREIHPGLVEDWEAHPHRQVKETTQPRRLGDRAWVLPLKKHSRRAIHFSRHHAIPGIICQPPEHASRVQSRANGDPVWIALSVQAAVRIPCCIRSLRRAVPTAVIAGRSCCFPPSDLPGPVTAEPFSTFKAKGNSGKSGRSIIRSAEAGLSQTDGVARKCHFGELPGSTRCPIVRAQKEEGKMKHLLSTRGQCEDVFLPDIYRLIVAALPFPETWLQAVCSPGSPPLRRAAEACIALGFGEDSRQICGHGQREPAHASWRGLRLPDA